MLAGAYRRPREVNWWFGLALLFLTLGFSLTGYLLPWDQKGYWATKVATNIMGGTPVHRVRTLQKIVVGGTDYGNQTVTRFYGLHVGDLARAAGALPGGARGSVPAARHHARRRRRSGRSTKFWPEQTLHGHGRWRLVFADGGRAGAGRGRSDAGRPGRSRRAQTIPARPEWYFLLLFQMLKHFPGHLEIIGTIVVSRAPLSCCCCLLPLLDRLLPSKFAHFLGCRIRLHACRGRGVPDRRSRFRPKPSTRSSNEDASRPTRPPASCFLAACPETGIPPDGAAFLCAAIR